MRSSARSRPSLAVLIVLALAAAAAPVASAGTILDAPAGDGPLKQAEQVITLITGDQITLRRGLGGLYEADVEAAPRPAGSPPVTFEALHSPSEDLYMIPSDAALLVAKGVLERDLFNVTWLVEQGYADAVRPTLPLIVKYRPQLAQAAQERRAQDLSPSTLTRTLESIDAAAVTVTKSNADAFWQGLLGQDRAAAPQSQERLEANAPSLGEVEAATSFGAGVAKVWLDRAVRVTLEQSVPQIGAPEVWQAGYDGAGVRVAVLDTGIDVSHPDVAGKVVASQSFIAGQAVADGHGHGTHVAATVAGTGAGSNGLRKGVAPGADLVIGKVLSNGGSGPASGVIDGMEWAALDQDADIVSMSLSGCCTDGTDPLSQAVNELSATTGALFVIAAGNDGPAATTIGTPGTADAALTVGAVDKQDAIANFSSRGPRLGDGGIKPNITAPGVDIVAARASGTSLGSPVDDLYTRASGTSMATPHVAGAAALLVQAHPDWDGEQIKDALVSTVQPGDYSIYQQGSGRVDVQRAVTQGVYASPATLHLGSFVPGQVSQPISKILTYTNGTDTATTLDLSLDIRDADNQPVPGHGVGLGAQQVAVPAHGAAQVTIQLDPADAAFGPIGGVVTATTSDGAVKVRTAVGYYQGPPSQTLTVRVLSSTGAPAANATVQALRIDDEAVGDDPLVRPVYQAVTDEAGEAFLVVPEGVYDIQARVDERVTLTSPWRDTFAYIVEHEVSDDDTVVLDARHGVELRPATPEQTDQRSFRMSGSRVTQAGNVWQWLHVADGPRQNQVWSATPTQRARIGQIEFSERWQLYEPLVELSVVRRGPDTALHPNYNPFPYDALELEGDHEYGVVPAYVSISLEGLPTDLFELLAELFARVSEDLAGLDVAGKAALVRIDPVDHSSPDVPLYVSYIAGLILTEAGAAAVLSYADAPGSIAVNDPAPREFGLTYAEGEALRKRLAADPGTKLRIKGQRSSPVIYQLHLRQQKLPTRQPSFDRRSMVRVDASYHYDPADVPCCNSNVEFTHSWGPIDGLSISTDTINLMPVERVEYVGPADDDVLWKRLICEYSPFCMEAYDVFPRPDRTEEDWFESPMYFGVPRPANTELLQERLGIWCAYCREGDFFWASMRTLLDGGTNTHYAHRALVEFWDPATSIKVFHNGAELPVTTTPWKGPGLIAGFQLTSTPGIYTLEQVDTVTPSNDLKIMSPKVTTTWKFRSERAKADYELQPYIYACPVSWEENCAFQPLIMLDYDLGVDIHNRAPADDKWRFTIEPYHIAPKSPRITSTKVWASTDGGATWSPAKVSRGGHGKFYVTVRHPELDETDGFVWLKVEALDGAGNTVTQITERAYGLRDAKDHKD